MTQGREDCEKCRPSKDCCCWNSNSATNTIASGLIQEGGVALLNLPEIVLLRVLAFCDISTLGCLSQVNKFLKNLIEQNQVWRQIYNNSIFSGQNEIKCCECKRSLNGLYCVAHHNGCSCTLSLKDRVHMCRNWMKGKYMEYRLLKAVRQMPSIYLEDGLLYRTDRNTVFRYRQKCNGQIQKSPVLAYQGLSDDVSRFLCRSGRVLAVSSGGQLISWDQSTGEVKFSYTTDHRGSVTCLDAVAGTDTVLTGAKDGNVAIWNVEEGLRCREKLVMNDRVWSLALTPTGDLFASGTAGLNQVPALRLWDVNRGCMVAVLQGADARNGAGILDLQYLTETLLLSCGYDTSVRLWDTRTSKCVRVWEEPFDVTVYCIRTLGAHSMVTGTALYGMARLWDQRTTQPVQKYYVSKTTSPVYSLAYDSSYLYLALDKGIHMLDFINK